MTSTETIEILQQAEQDAREGKCNNAIYRYKLYLTIEPRSIRAWKGIFRSLNNTERYEEALQAAHTMVSLYPEDGACLHDLAYALWHVKKYEAAIQAISRSIALDAENFLSYTLAHMIYDSIGNDVAAQDVLEFAKTKFPNDARIYAMLGVYAEKRNMPEKALDYFQSAWLLNHLDLKLLDSIGKLSLSLGRMDEARKAWETIADHESLVQSAKRNLKKYKPEKH